MGACLVCNSPEVATDHTDSCCREESTGATREAWRCVVRKLSRIEGYTEYSDTISDNFYSVQAEGDKDGGGARTGLARMWPFRSDKRYNISAAHRDALAEFPMCGLYRV